MNETTRQIAGLTLDVPGVNWILRRRTRSLGIVFMLHRMACPELGTGGHRAEDLRAFLSYLRRRKIRVVPVCQMIREARAGGMDRGGPLVSFTLDDGYQDQAVIAAPIFREFGVPATLFPVTEFLDGARWMWWDRLSLLFSEAPSGTYRLPLPGGGPESVTLDSSQARTQHRQRFEWLFKSFPAKERDELLVRWQDELRVALPDKPPERFAPMTWDQARDCEAMGITIGPHTVTHPILSRESTEQVRWEMAESWRRLQKEVSAPVPVYCYSNGTPRDFGRREMKIAGELGLEGALSTIAGYLRLAPPPHGDAVDPEAHFALPRYSLPGDMPGFKRVVTGLAPGLIHRIPAAPESWEPRREGSLSSRA